VDGNRVAGFILESVRGDVLNVVQNEWGFEQRAGDLVVELVHLLEILLKSVKEIIGDIEIKYSFFQLHEQELPWIVLNPTIIIQLNLVILQKRFPKASFRIIEHYLPTEVKRDVHFSVRS